MVKLSKNKIDSDLLETFKDLVDIYNQSFENNHLIDEILAKAKDVITKFPLAAEPYFLLCLVSVRLGDEGHAISMCEIAHKLDPNTKEYAETLSILYTSVGKLTDGLYYAKISQTMEPHEYISQIIPDKLKDLETALKTVTPSNHFIEAIRMFDRADYAQTLKECSSEIRLNKDNFDAYILLARTLIIIKSFNQAASALQAAIQLKPEYGLPRAMLGRALVNLGEYEEAAVSAEQGILKDPSDPETFAQAMDAILHCPKYPLDKAKALAIAFQETLDAKNLSEVQKDTLTVPNEKLSIGLISNAFSLNKHSSKFLSWFVGPKWSEASLIGYQQSVTTDFITTSAMQKCSNWREIFDLDDYTLELTIKGENLDVLVDLSNVNWKPKLNVLGAKPCATRIGTFLLPEPGFAPGITHILCDDVIVESTEDTLLPDQEKIVINGSIFSRPPYFVLSNDKPLPAEQNKLITFGGVMDLINLTPECAALWSGLLLSIPNSRLLLHNPGNTIKKVKAKVCEYFSHNGVLDRIIFPKESEEEEERRPELAEALIPSDFWESIDIFLDTFPFNCTYENCEALWTGVPVISMKSARRGSLFGASILTAAKRLNWIANSPEEFTEIGKGLTKDIKKLKKERLRLQKNIKNSALFDPNSLSLDIEIALTSLAKKSRPKLSHN